MSKILKAIGMTFIVSCAVVAIYFIVTLITSTDAVTDSYEAMTNDSITPMQKLKYNLLVKYVSQTGDTEILYAMGVGQNTIDSIIEGVEEEDDDLEDDDPTNTPEDEDDPDDDFDPGNIKPINPGEGNTELNAISLSKGIDGFNTWAQGTPKIYSSSGSSGCCFYVAMLGVVNHYGANAGVGDIFKAGGLSVKNKVGGGYQLSGTVGGSVGKVNQILKYFSISATAAELTAKDYSSSGLWLIHETSGSKKYYSSSGEHWFAVYNGKVVTPARGHEGEQFDKSKAQFNHFIKIG